MMKVDVKGFDKLSKHLDKIVENARKLDDQAVPLDDILNDDFVAKHSSFSSFNDLLDSSPFKVETKEDFEAIPDAEWDTYIASKTSFSSWEEMQKEAASEHISKLLGF